MGADTTLSALGNITKTELMGEKNEALYHLMLQIKQEYKIRVLLIAITRIKY